MAAKLLVATEVRAFTFGQPLLRDSRVVLGSGDSSACVRVNGAPAPLPARGAVVIPAANSGRHRLACTGVDAVIVKAVYRLPPTRDDVRGISGAPRRTVLHVLPHPGGGGETYVDALEEMEGYRFERAYLVAPAEPEPSGREHDESVSTT